MLHTTWMVYPVLHRAMTSQLLAHVLSALSLPALKDRACVLNGFA